MQLTDFIDAIERVISQPAARNLLEMQLGDVPATWANAALLHGLTGYTPQTNIVTGVGNFVAWYRSYFDV